MTDMTTFKLAAFSLCCILWANRAAGQSSGPPEGLLNDTAIYLFARGSRSKAGAIARKFNASDTLISHVGIGYVECGTVRIFNVVDNRPPGKSALVVDTYESFVDEGTSYVSVWKAASTLAELKVLKSELAGLEQRNIAFDHLFELGGEKFYCSEFCCLLLKKTNAGKYDYAPRVAELEKFQSMVLGRKELVYYPADFFQQKEFERVYEEWIGKR